MNLAYELGAGVVLGFSLTIPPGPMNAYIASQSVRSRRRGVVSGLGAMSADAVLGAVVFVLSSTLDLHENVRGIYALGGVVMAYFGWRLLRSPPREERPNVGDARTYSTAVGLGLTNPFQILWWLSAGLAFAYVGGPVLLAGLFGAIAIWIVVFPLALAAGAQRSPRVERAITLLAGATMVGFAAYFAWLAL